MWTRGRLSYYSLNRYQWGQECIVRVFSFFVAVHAAHLSWELWSRRSRIENGRWIVHIKATIRSSPAKAGVSLCAVPFFSLGFVPSPHPPQHHLSQAEWLLQTHFTATSLTNSPPPCVPPPLPLPSMWHLCDLSLSLWGCGFEYINMCYDFLCWVIWKYLLSTLYKAVFCLSLSELLMIDV